jgi:hypothetical protein
VTQTPGYLSPTTLLPVRTRSDYIASAAHYECVARRILVALRGSNRPLVLVTGDPLPDPEGVLEALGKVAGPGYAPIIIACRPELRREDLERAIPPWPPRTAIIGVEADQRSSAHASPVFIFDDFDQLSDAQIKSFLETQNQRAAVLLALPDFLDRLERPALRFLNDRMAAQFRFQEIGDDEAVAFLHNQLLSQADRRVEVRGFRRGILVGLAAGGAAIAVSIGAFTLRPTPEQVYEVPANTGYKSLVDREGSMLRPTDDALMMQAAPNVHSHSLSMSATPPLSAPSQPTKGEDPAPVATTSVEHPQAGPSLSATEITILLTRGDALLGTGDITSARLFYEHVYERAANAGSGQAALRLGATFDPAFASRAVSRATVDPAQALFWYRRARELGVGEAEQRIKRLENPI